MPLKKVYITNTVLVSRVEYEIPNIGFEDTSSCVSCFKNCFKINTITRKLFTFTGWMKNSNYFDRHA